jgi:hypothetical protein
MYHGGGFSVDEAAGGIVLSANKLKNHIRSSQFIFHRLLNAKSYSWSNKDKSFSLKQIQAGQYDVAKVLGDEKLYVPPYLQKYASSAKTPAVGASKLVSEKQREHSSTATTNTQTAHTGSGTSTPSDSKQPPAACLDMATIARHECNAPFHDLLQAQIALGKAAAATLLVPMQASLVNMTIFAKNAATLFDKYEHFSPAHCVLL